MKNVGPSVCYKVEKIIGVSVGEGNVRNYHVQWEPSWINGVHLIGCELLIEEFLHNETDKNQPSTLTESFSKPQQQKRTGLLPQPQKCHQLLHQSQKQSEPKSPLTLEQQKRINPEEKKEEDSSSREPNLTPNCETNREECLNTSKRNLRKRRRKSYAELDAGEYWCKSTYRSRNADKTEVVISSSEDESECIDNKKVVAGYCDEADGVAGGGLNYKTNETGAETEEKTVEEKENITLVFTYNDNEHTTEKTEQTDWEGTWSRNVSDHEDNNTTTTTSDEKFGCETCGEVYSHQGDLFQHHVKKRHGE